MVHISPEEEELLKKAWTAYDWTMLKFNTKLRFLFQGWALRFKHDIKTVKDIAAYATEQLEKKQKNKFIDRLV